MTRLFQSSSLLLVLLQFLLLSNKGNIIAAFDLSFLDGNAKAKSRLLEAVSNTANGKNASPERQLQVLEFVNELEQKAGPIERVLTDNNQLKKLDGVWYLQYTSPSTIVIDENDEDQEPPEDDTSWKPEFASEGSSNIETRPYQAKGTVSAAGITVDTSNRVVQQIFDIQEGTVVNKVDLDLGCQITVGGVFRQSPNVPNRAIVAFDRATISLFQQKQQEESGLKIELGWVFSILAILRGSKDSGWLETTFLDDEVRLGRGNKGTMFVLTRDRNAVTS